MNLKDLFKLSFALLTCTFSLIGFSQINPIAQYKFEHNPNDNIGSNNGVINGNVSYEPFNGGQAATFDGINDWIDIPPNSEMVYTDQITVSLWAKWATLPGSGTKLIEIGNNDFILEQSSSSNRLQVIIGGNNYRPFYSVEANVWYHIAATYDGSITNLYVNGTLVGNEPNTNNLSGRQLNTRIGTNDTGGQDFKGSMSDVRFYDQALTSTEMFDLYSSYLGVNRLSLNTNTIIQSATGGSQNVTVTVNTDFTNSSQYHVFKTQDIIIDTDANNEVDDQNALAYLLSMSDEFNVLGVTSAHGGATPIADHTAEAQRIVDLMDLNGVINVYEGSQSDYSTVVSHLANPTHEGYEAVDFIISQAQNYSSSNRLTLLPIGKITNIALAIAKDPTIIDKIRIVWLGSNYPLTGEFNFGGDTDAVNYILAQNIPFDMFLVRGTNDGTADIGVEKIELETVLTGAGPTVTPVNGRSGGTFTNIGDYLIRLVNDTGDGWRALYDVVPIACLVNPNWGTPTVIGAPSWNGSAWVENPSNTRQITIWDRFDEIPILTDFLYSIKNYDLVGSPSTSNEWLNISLSGYTITITTTSNSGNVRSSKVIVTGYNNERKTLTITQYGSEDVDIPPFNLSLSSSTIDENSIGLVGTLSSSGNPTADYTITNGNDQASFSIKNNNELHVDVAFDYEIQTSAQVEITATNSVGSSSNIFTININDLNDPVFTYTDWPVEPTRGSVTTLNRTSHADEVIETVDLNGNRDVVIDGDWSGRMRALKLFGDIKNPYRFFLDWNSIGGEDMLPGKQVLMFTDFLAWDDPDPNAHPESNYIEVYNGYLEGNPDVNVNGVSGMKFSPHPNGSHMKVQGVVSMNMSFANFFNNEVSGLNGSDYYQDIEYNFVLAVGHDIEGEGFYLGSTNKTTGEYSITRNLTITNALVNYKGRDGVQLNSVFSPLATDNGFYLSNITVHDVGREEDPSQRFLLQIQNSSGVLENSIFDESYAAAIIAGRDIKIKNSYFRATGDGGHLYIQRNGTAYGEPQPVSNEGIIFEDCYFVWEGLFDDKTPVRVDETEVPVIFRNCVFESVQTITYTGGSRVEGSGNFIRNNSAGNIILENCTFREGSKTLPDPTFSDMTYPFPKENREDYGLVTSQWHYDKGMGYRTPPPSKAPSGLRINNNTINEETTGLVGKLIAQGNPTPSFTITGGINELDFSIINENELLLDNAFSFENNLSLEVEITATNSEGSEIKLFNIDITESDKLPTDISLENSTISDGTLSGSVISTINSDGDPIEFQLISGNGDTDNDSFSIVNDELLINENVDFDTKASYSIRIQAFNNAGNFEKAFTISVTTTDFAPTDISLENRTISDGTLSGSVISTINSDGNPIEFQLISGNGDTDNKSFSILNDELLINENVDFDTKASYSIRIQAFNNAGSFEQAFTINVISTDVAPSEISLENLTIPDRTLGGSIISSISSDGTPIEFQLITGDGDSDNGFFTINGNNLIINELVNLQSKSTYSIRIQAFNNAGSFDKSFNLSVTGTDIIPTDISLSSTMIPNGTETGSEVSEIISDGSPIDFQLVSGEGDTDNNFFYISASSLIIEETANFESKNTYTIRIQASNNAGSFSKTFNLEVTSDNIAPTTITIDNTSIADGTPTGSNVGSISSDGSPITFDLVEGDGDDDNSLFSLSGESLIINQNVDFNQKSFYLIRIRASNNSGSVEAKFNLSVSSDSKPKLKVIVNDLEKLYGEKNPQFSFSITGFIDGDNLQSLEQIPFLTTEATKRSDVGEYPITANGGASNKYDFEYNNGILLVKKTNLSVSVKDESIMYQEVIPEFTISYDGFKLDDSITDLTALPVATTDANSSSKPGEYAITLSGGDAKNYLFTYNNALLTILYNCELTVEISYDENNYSLSTNINGGIAPYNYSWSTGEFTETINIIQTGEYSVTVIDDYNCIARDTISVSIDDNGNNITGIRDYNKPIIWPNPIYNWLSIESEELIKKVTFYSMTGAEIHKCSINKMKTKIKTEQLKVGTYVIVVESNASIHRLLIHKK